MTTQQMDALDDARRARTEGDKADMNVPDDVEVILDGLNHLMAAIESGYQVVVWHDLGKRTIWPGHAVNDLYARVKANASRIGALL